MCALVKNGRKPPERCPRCLRPFALPDYLEQVLQGADQPLSLMQLVRALEKRGILPAGSEKTGEVCNALKRNPQRFRKAGWGLYEVAK